MGESLESFLGETKSDKKSDVSGSLACQECDEVVYNGGLDEDTMILTYTCSKNHESKVKL
jgi:hypothetical protein